MTKKNTRFLCYHEKNFGGGTVRSGKSKKVILVNLVNGNFSHSQVGLGDY